MDPKLVRRYIGLEVTRLAGMAVALFWSAGRIDWWPAWGALAVMAGWMIGTAVIIFRHNPALLAERLRTGQGTRRWDTVIVSTLGLTTLARYILAGLDQRNGWTGGFPLAAQLIALAVCALGYALFTWATAANAFFSNLLHIQSERGHRAVTGGPYRYVRHPAYAGAIGYELAAGILFASWPALLVGVLDSGLLLLRTALEDRALQAELPGYADYTRQVRWRLLPGVW